MDKEKIKKLENLENKILNEIDFYLKGEHTDEEMNCRIKQSLTVSKLVSNVVQIENTIQASSRLLLGNKENTRKRERYGNSKTKT